MTSRSIASRSERVLLGALVALILLVAASPAHANKRLVVLEFDGPKAERFRDDVEQAVKKGNTIVSLDDWTEAASDLRAEKATARNVKKVAKELGVDGVIVGDVEKRGQRYYIHLKLREGASGDYVAEVDIVVRQAKLGSDGARTIKDELLPAIKELTAVRRSKRDDGDDDEPARTSKKAKKGKSGFGGKRSDDEEEEEDDEDEDEEPTRTSKKGKKTAKKGKQASRDDEDDDDNDDDDDDDRGSKARKTAKKDDKKGKKQASRDDDDEDDGGDDDGDDDGGDDEDDRGDDDDDDRVALGDDDERGRGDDDDGGSVSATATRAGDPRFPAVEVGAGLSVTGRSLGFSPAAGVAPVQGYKGNPVAGVVINADVFPLAFNDKSDSPLRNLGITVLFDRVIKIESKVAYEDAQMMAQELALPSTQQRYAAGLVYRHPLSDQLAIEGAVRYNRMKFAIDKDQAGEVGVTIQIPNVDYTFVDPGVGVRYALSPQLLLGAGASFAFVLNTGEMQNAEEYGAATVLGFELDGGVSYRLTPQIVLRAEARLTTFGFSFKGTGMMSNPDGDATVDIPSGRDTYFGGAATASYQF